MDGSMWYANGGGGIFQHVDGPFADDCDPVVVGTGFGARGGFGALGQDGAAVDQPVFTLEDTARMAAETTALLRDYASGSKTLGDDIRNSGLWAQQQRQGRSAWVAVAWVAGGLAVVGAGAAVVLAARRRRRRA